MIHTAIEKLMNDFKGVIHNWFCIAFIVVTALVCGLVHTVIGLFAALIVTTLAYFIHDYIKGTPSEDQEDSIVENKE